jgi:hypothetical protein
VVVTRDGGYNVRDWEQARGGWRRKRGCRGIYSSRRRVLIVAFGISERKNDSKVHRQETDAPSASTTGQILAT